MPIFNINNKATSQSINGSMEDIANFLSPNNSNYGYINADKALKNSDIYSLVFQLSSDLARSSLIADLPRAQGILSNPSKTTNARAFWQSMYAQLLLGGEAFAYRFRNINGTDYRWEYLRPSQVSPFLLADGSGLIYNVTFDEPEIGIMQNVSSNDMIHIRLMSKNGGMTGISPLTALASELNIKDNANDLTLKALQQSAIAPGILHERGDVQLDGSLKSKRSKKVTQELQNGVLVLDNLEEFQPLEIKSNVASLLSQVNWTGKQIAKVYGVPDSVINGTGDQQSSLDMESTAYLKSIARFSNSITGELNDKLNANITMDLRSAVDPLGDNAAKTISSLAKDGSIAPNQAVYLMEQSKFTTDGLPEPIWPVKGGDNNAKS